MQTWVKVVIGVVVLGGISTVAYLLIGSGGSGSGAAKISVPGSGSKGPGSGSKGKKPTGPKLEWDWAASYGGQETLHILGPWDRTDRAFDKGDRVVVRSNSGGTIGRATVIEIFADNATMMKLDKQHGFANRKGPGTVQKLG